MSTRLANTSGEGGSSSNGDEGLKETNHKLESWREGHSRVDTKSTALGEPPSCSLAFRGMRGAEEVGSAARMSPQANLQAKEAQGPGSTTAGRRMACEGPKK